MRSRIGGLASAAVLLLLAGHLLLPLLECGNGCFPDYETLRGPALGKLEAPDARLNAWILAWVHHATFTAPSALFDANVFYPARDTLAGSEHMLGIAVLLLPLQLFGADAVGLHQAAVALSFVLLAATTFALVRWLTGSSFAALVAAAAAMHMPWRISELSHVQLLNAQWFPLAWLLMGRIASGDVRRRTLASLSAVVTLQVLSSFYLAYFLLFSLAFWAASLALVLGMPRAAWLALAKAAVVPALLLALASIPYLTWQSSSGFVPTVPLFDSVTPADAWSVIGPQLELGLRGAPPQGVNYEVPLAVFVLAALAALWAGSSRASGKRIRAAVLALWMMGLVAFVLALGREMDVGGSPVRLPAHWLALFVPGFDNLRNPLRWAIVIGLALPPLAGIGIAGLERLAASRLEASRRTTGLLALRAGIAGVCLLSIPTVPIPARAAWEHPERAHALYRAVDALPEGALIEIPWPLQSQRDIQLASRYMLGSTLHWKPITNGTSGYSPASYLLLRQVAQRLPHPDALAQLRRLVDARWLVVHDERLLPQQRAAWTAAARSGALRQVLSRQPHRIYEIPDGTRDARWMEALRSRQRRPLTLAGLPRSPLALAADAGRLVVQVPGDFQYRGGRRIPQLLPLRIENESDVAWPGIDPDPEGLVRLRYTFESRDGSFSLTETSALVTDLPAGRSVTTFAPVLPPRRAGEHRLRLELVQQVGGELRPLPVPAASIRARVVEAERHAAPM